jgi:hypothetical protein
MSDLQYITGIIRSAEQITGISGTQTFGGHDSQGYFTYDGRLNPLAGQRVRLFPAEQLAYDYIVDTTGGINIRDDWATSIQTEVFWDEVPVDTPIEVSNDNSTWKKMYFAEYIPASPDLKLYYVFVAGRTSYSTIGGTEVFEVTMAVASGLNSKYFLMYSSTKTYYVWFSVDGAGINPAGPGGPLAGLGYYSVPITLVSTDTAEMVATKTKVVIDGLAEFLAIISPINSKIVAVASSTSGSIFDPQSGNSGLTIVIKVQGGDKESYRYARIP